MHDGAEAGAELVGVSVLIVLAALLVGGAGVVDAALLAGGSGVVTTALLVGEAGVEDAAEEGVSVDTVVGVADGPARPARRLPSGWRSS